MEQVLQGKAVLLGKNIDTDQIYPGRFLALVDPKDIGEHCLEGHDPELRKLLNGGIVVADTNFGCGSSREHAVITLLNAGVKAVVAESFARIFYRNAINLGLPVVVCKGLSKAVEMGQEVTVDIAEGTVTLNGSGETMACDKIGEYVMNILASGGIKPMFRAKSGL